MVAYLCWESATVETGERAIVIKTRKWFIGAHTERLVSQQVWKIRISIRTEPVGNKTNRVTLTTTRAESLTS